MTFHNILIIKVRAMGDTLLATPMISSLRQAYPQARLTALVSPAGQPVLQDNPDLNHVMVFDKSIGVVDYGRLLMQLRAAQYDLVINCHASFRTALLAKLTGVRSRISHNHSGKNYFATIPMTAKKEPKSSIERDLDTLRALGIKPATHRTTFTINDQAWQWADQFIQTHQLGGKDGFMLLAPGAGQTIKRWPTEHVIAFLNMTRQFSKLLWVVLAGPLEQDLMAAIKQAFGEQIPICQGRLQQVAAVIGRGKGMVTADSGPKHLACSLGTKTLTLWTNEPLAEWHPYDLKMHPVLQSSSGQVQELMPNQVWQQAIRIFPNLA